MVDRQAGPRLHDLVGNGLEALDNELAKLSVYVGPRPRICVEDVEALVGQHREEVIFRVTDAMSAGNASTALTAWEQVLATDRAAPMQAIAGLAWSIRQLLQAKQAVEAGASPGSVAPRFGQAAFLDRLKQVSAETLKQQLSELHDADLATKTGLADAKTAVETFIVKHSVEHSTPARTPVGRIHG